VRDSCERKKGREEGVDEHETTRLAEANTHVKMRVKEMGGKERSYREKRQLRGEVPNRFYGYHNRKKNAVEEK